MFACVVSAKYSGTGRTPSALSDVKVQKFLRLFVCVFRKLGLVGFVSAFVKWWFRGPEEERKSVRKSAKLCAASLCLLSVCVRACFFWSPVSSSPPLHQFTSFRMGAPPEGFFSCLQVSSLKKEQSHWRRKKCIFENFCPHVGGIPPRPPLYGNFKITAFQRP